MSSPNNANLDDVNRVEELDKAKPYVGYGGFYISNLYDTELSNNKYLF